MGVNGNLGGDTRDNRIIWRSKYFKFDLLRERTYTHASTHASPSLLLPLTCTHVSTLIDTYRHLRTHHALSFSLSHTHFPSPTDTHTHLYARISLPPSLTHTHTSLSLSDTHTHSYALNSLRPSFLHPPSPSSTSTKHTHPNPPLYPASSLPLSLSLCRVPSCLIAPSISLSLALSLSHTHAARACARTYTRKGL